jgi:ubiquinone biosynthesis protein COQ9
MSVTESMTRLQAQREALVEAALEHVPFDGWTKQVLKAGAEDLDLAPGEVDRLLPNGIRQAISTYVELTDRKMMTALDEKGLENLKIRDRIATAVKTRLETDPWDGGCDVDCSRGYLDRPQLVHQTHVACRCIWIDACLLA